MSHADAIRRVLAGYDGMKKAEGVPPHLQDQFEEETAALRAAIAALEERPACETFEVGPIMVRRGPSETPMASSIITFPTGHRASMHRNGTVFVSKNGSGYVIDLDPVCRSIDAAEADPKR